MSFSNSRFSLIGCDTGCLFYSKSSPIILNMTGCVISDNEALKQASVAYISYQQNEAAMSEVFDSMMNFANCSFKGNFARKEYAGVFYIDDYSMKADFSRVNFS